MTNLQKMCVISLTSKQNIFLPCTRNILLSERKRKQRVEEIINMNIVVDSTKALSVL